MGTVRRTSFVLGNYVEIGELLQKARQLAVDASRAELGFRVPLPDTLATRIKSLEDDPRAYQFTTEAKDAFREAIDALERGVPKAALVFSWGLVIDSVHEVLWQDQFATVNAHRKNAKGLRRRDQIRELHDHDVLVLTREIGVLSLVTYRRLLSMLNERNAYGHVGSGTVTFDLAISYVEQALFQADQIAQLRLPAAVGP